MIDICSTFATPIKEHTKKIKHMNTIQIPIKVQFTLNAELNQLNRSLGYLHASLALAIEEGNIVEEDYCFKRIDLVTDRIVELDTLLNRYPR
jgi:hypothetical protein